MKKIIVLWPLTLIILLFCTNCEDKIVETETSRVNLDIVVVDTTGTYQEYLGQNLVPDADVYINSISYYDYFSCTSDENGVAQFTEILPDRYNVTVTGKLDISSNKRIISNGNLQNISYYQEMNIDTVYVTSTNLSPLVISELYYNGSPPQDPYNIPQYFHDQFIELYNNSSDTLYLDSLIIADVDFGHAEEDYIYAIHAQMFPGTGKDYPLAPGQFVVVAQDGVDHTELVPNSVDLSNADFEYYIADQADVDYVDVPNMVTIHHKYGIDFLMSVFNEAVVILKVDDPYAGGYSEFDCLKLPKSGVLDGLDYRDNLAEVDYKRLDASIDAGLTGGFESYQNKSVHRQIESEVDGRIILMDNNNSSIDFIVLDHPTPGYFFDE